MVVKLQYPRVSDTHLTFWPISLGKACLDTRIRWLNPELYEPGRKNMDSTMLFAPIATWSDPFCHIQKSHTQLHIWNHACTFTYFPFFVAFWFTYHDSIFSLRLHIIYLKQRASLNKHFLSNTSLFVNCYCNYMFICRLVKYRRIKK